MAGWPVPGLVHLHQMRKDPVGQRAVARHHITRRPLAVTYLSDEFLTDIEFRTRFARDFTRLARVRDARIARVHRYVECHHGAAVIGERVRGTSLRDLLLTHGAVGTEAALVVLSDALRGLAAWHAAGVTHGDIKPENLILTPHGRVRLVDCGLWTSDGRRLLARSTPFYLASEQWSGHRASPAADLYAAMITFFESLVGAPPFHADGSAELLAKHEQSMPPIDMMPGSVRDLVRNGLAKDPHRRGEAQRLLTDVVEIAAHSVGAGWDQRGRRELARLVTNRSALPDTSPLDRRRVGAGAERRRPVRLAAVVGGALALAAGLASPPLAVLPGASIFSGARSPVLAFPEPAPVTPPETNGSRADRTVRTRTAPATKAATTAKAAPAGRAAAKTPPDRQGALAPAIPDVDPWIAMGEYARPPGPADEGARPRFAPAPACTPMRMARHQPCSAPLPGQRAPWSTGMESQPRSPRVPASIALPAIELPGGLQVPVPALKQIQPLEDLLPSNDLLAPKDLLAEAEIPAEVEIPQHRQPRAVQRGWEKAAQAREDDDR